MINLNFNFQDICQIAIGSFALAVPISFSEEAWRLGETLPKFNILLIFCLSITFLAIYSYEGVFQGRIKNRIFIYIIRIVIAYMISGLVVALVLFSLNKFPLLSDPFVAIRRLIIVSMPAAMGAIVVDGFDKE